VTARGGMTVPGLSAAAGNATQLTDNKVLDPMPARASQPSVFLIVNKTHSHSR
jgi:hypothetical protein